jgi:hypothetical protein
VHGPVRVDRRVDGAALAAAALALSATLALAADDPAPRPASDKLAGARALIADKQVGRRDRGAEEGQRQRQRRLEQPDGLQPPQGQEPRLRGRRAPLHAALRIDAKHRGALEYSGELYLMLGDLAKAEAAPGRARQGLPAPATNTRT